VNDIDSYGTVEQTGCAEFPLRKEKCAPEPMHHVIKSYGSVGVSFMYSVFTTVLGGGEWSASRSSRFHSREGVCCTHLILSRINVTKFIKVSLFSYGQRFFFPAGYVNLEMMEFYTRQLPLITDCGFFLERTYFHSFTPSWNCRASYQEI
jgi:hypothetical protein